VNLPRHRFSKILPSPLELAVLSKFQLPEEDAIVLGLFEVGPNGEYKVIPGTALISAINLDASKIILQPKNIGSGTLPKKRKSGFFTKRSGIFS